MTTQYWYAVQTRPRAEYAALADINSMDGLEAYLPQETRQRRTRKGKEAVHHPLLPGFIFVRSAVPPIVDADSPDHPHPIFDVLKSKAVRGLVRSPGGGVHPIRPQVIDGWRVNFVDHLREREAAGAFDYTPRQKPLIKGGDVRILSGAFKDQIGKLLSVPADGRAEIMMGGLFAGRMSVDMRSLEAA